MSENNLQQGIPVIIKGGSKSGSLPRAIEIQANSVFSITEQFQSQPNDWTQSDSDYSVSYVESITVGELGGNLQFCQTSTMAHPLTFNFKDSEGKNIFTIQEVADGFNYLLQISVDLTDDYFQVTDQSNSPNETWTASTFNTTDSEVAIVEVINANNVPVCQLLRTDVEDIILNIEPPV